MSIPINSLCYRCLMPKYMDRALAEGDPAAATAFSREMMRLFLEAEPDVSSAVIGDRIRKAYARFFPVEEDRYQKEKAFSNAFVMERLDAIRQKVEAADDPLYAALQFSVLGNYLDFAALGNTVSFEDLEQMLSSALTLDLDKTAYEAFRADLKKANSMLYLTDNAGEIVFDRVLAQQLQKQYPQVKITFCVRGYPVHNDATREDAAAAGIEFPVIDSGDDLGGTVLGRVNEQTRTAIAESDVVLAKGMGNTETLYGCGFNVYYAFLVKCPRFAEFFQEPHLTPMFIKERK